MKILLYSFLGVCILIAIIIKSFFMLREKNAFNIDKDFLRSSCFQAIVVIISVYLGFFASFALNHIITSQEEQKEKDKIIVLLKKEFSQNYANLNNIETLLKADLDFLKKGKITITPLGDFYFDAWDKVRSSNSNFLIKMATKDFMKLTNCYFILKIIQTKVRDRELYRIYNESRSSNFLERMEVLDKNILDAVEKIRPVFKQAQDYLYEIHDWKVAGGSFYTDEGLVVELDYKKTSTEEVSKEPKVEDKQIESQGVPK